METDQHPYEKLLDAAREYVEAYDSHRDYLAAGAAVGSRREQISFQRVVDARHNLYGVIRG